MGSYDCNYTYGLVLIFLWFHILLVMFRTLYFTLMKMATHGWLKYVAVHCVHKLISTYSYA